MSYPTYWVDAAISREFISTFDPEFILFIPLVVCGLLWKIPPFDQSWPGFHEDWLFLVITKGELENTECPSTGAEMTDITIPTFFH
jgi:hypothetical protein